MPYIIPRGLVMRKLDYIPEDHTTIHLVTLGERKIQSGMFNCSPSVRIVDYMSNIRDHLYHFEANRKKGTIDANLLIPSGTWKERIMENRMASIKRYVN